MMGQVRQAIPVFLLLAVVALASSIYLRSSDRKPVVDQSLVAGLPMFLQDDEEAVEASLVGWHNNQPNQR